jgi:hypothetical protein
MPPSLTKIAIKTPLFQPVAATEGVLIAKRRLADREAGLNY